MALTGEEYFWIGWGCGVGGMLLGDALVTFVRIRRIKAWRP